MPSLSTEAIVLRAYDVAENDRIFSVFTRDFGKIRGMALGCKRIKAGNMGWQDIGSLISIHIYEREGSELARFSHWRLIEHYQQEPKWENLLYHMYIVDLLNEFTMEHNPHPGVFRLAVSVLHSLSGPCFPSLLTRYFEYWILRLEGIWPGHHRCTSCSSPLQTHSTSFSPQSMRFYCLTCSPSGSLPLGPDDFYSLHCFSRLSPHEIRSGMISPSTLNKLESISQFLIQRHLEHCVKSYRLLKELIAA
jgi:DNA repair protein RecO (recombination protein O)